MLPLAAGTASMPKFNAAPDRAPSPHDADALALELYAADIGYGIVRSADKAPAGEGPSATVLQRFARRARTIIYNLGRVPDSQIVEACRAEGAGTPRGRAAAAELRHRRLG
jgi:hypothetical protein